MADIANVFTLLDDETLYLYVLINPQGTYDPYAFWNATNINATNFNFQNVHFCNYAGVQYGGIAYTPIPCSISDLTYTENAEASPTITIGDYQGIIGSILGRTRGIEGCEFSIQRIKRRALDDGANPNFLYRQAPEIFKVSSLTSRTSKGLSYKLKPRVTLKDKIPGRTMTQSCSWKQYRGAGCNYNGSAMFDENDNPTSDRSRDICGLTRKSCNLRGNFTNYGGFPSIDGF